MSYVNFYPFVGNNYHKGLFETGHTVLVLGESHYCTDLGCGKCKGCSLPNCIALGHSWADYAGQTDDYINESLHNNTGKGNQQTILRFERAMFGKTPTQSEKKMFWHSVVFYNYIQKALPKIPGKRTKFTSADLVGADLAFREVLEIFMPDRVIAWGCRLFDYALPNWGGSLSTIKISSGAETDVWTYTIKNKAIPVLKTVHPSCSQANDWKKWHQFYKVFLK